MTTTFMNNFLDEMCGGLAAISSVDNYAELGSLTLLKV